MKREIQSDMNINVKYTVDLNEKGEPISCNCPSKKKCKHLYRAAIEDTFKEKWNNLIEMGFNPKFLLEKEISKVNNKNLIVLFGSKNIKNTAIQNFLNNYEILEKRFLMEKRSEFLIKAKHLLKYDIFFSSKENILSYFKNLETKYGKIKAINIFLNEKPVGINQ